MYYRNIIRVITSDSVSSLKDPSLFKNVIVSVGIIGSSNCFQFLKFCDYKLSQNLDFHYCTIMSYLNLQQALKELLFCCVILICQFLWVYGLHVPVATLYKW